MADLTIKLVMTADGTRLTRAVDAAGRKVGELGGKAQRAGDEASRGLGRASNGASRLSRALGNARGGIDSVLGSLRGLTAAAGAVGLVSLATSAMDTYRSFESLNASLKTVTGSAEAAEAAFALIEDFATTTPYSLEEAVRAFVKLKAMGLDPSREALTSYGNTAAAMGKSLNDMIEAVADAATGEFERLKEFGIKARVQGDQVAFTFQGITTVVGKNAEEIQQYLLSIGNTEFAGAMADQMNTVNGAISNLGDAFAKLQRDFVEKSGAADTYKAVLHGLTRALEAVNDHIEAVASAASALAKVALAGLIIKLGRARMAALGLGPALAGARAKLLQFTVQTTRSMTAVNLLNKSLAALGKSLNVFMAALAGWEFGTWLRDNFLEAKLAGIAMVRGLLTTWERLKYGARVAAAALKLAFLKAIEALTGRFADLFDMAAKGFAALGGDETARKLRAIADHLRPAKGAFREFQATVQTARDEMDRAIGDIIKTTDDMADAEIAAANASKDHKKKLEATRAELGRLGSQLGKAAGKQNGLKKATDEARKAAEEQQRAYRDLLREINPLQAASDDYAAKLAILKRELDAGRITAKEYEEQVWALDQKMLGFGDDAQDTADKVAKAADPMADAWKRATERIDQSFADAFKGGFKSFKDFAGNIKNALRDLLAELAYQLAKSKFFQLLGGLSGRGGFLGSLGGLVPSGAFAAGEAGGLPGGGLPGGVPGMSGVLGTQVGATTLGGLGLAAGGGYLVGGFLEDRLGGNAQIGTTLGSTAGMLIGGPLGAVVGGALGGLVGSMFGGKWKTRDSGVELSYSGGDLTGQQYEYQKKRNLLRSKTRTRYSELDSKVQAALNAAFDTIEQGVQQIADNLGKDVQQAIDSFTAEGKISLKGLSPEEAQAKLQDWVNRTGGQLMAAVLPEFFGIIRAAGDRAGELLQPLLSLSQYIGEDWAPHVATTLTGAARQAREAVERQLADYDGSVEATQRLAQAVQARYQVEQELLRQIGQVRESVKGMTDDLLADLGRALRTDQEQFDWLTQQRLLLRQQLEAASDPEEIQRLTAKVLSVTREQMQMMSAEQLKANAENITAFVRQVRTIAEDKLRQAEEVVKTEHQEIAGATRATLQSASQSIAEAARNMNQAAANLNVAAASMNNAAGAHIQAASVQTQILAWNWNGYDSGF